MSPDDGATDASERVDGADGRAGHGSVAPAEPVDAPGLFVVGTDTGVGKTVVTAGLTGWLREEGVDATAIKPAQTGAPADDDAEFVAEAAGERDAAVCLRKLGPALAPRVAAELEDRELDYGAIRSECREAVDAAEVAVVEGIGGLRVPLAGDREVVDLVADLGLPAVVVARSGLGTLNHTSLTVEALRARDVPVRQVVLNRYEAADLAEETNPAELRRMLDLPVATLGPFDAEDPGAVVPAVRSGLPDALLDGLR